MAFFQGSYFSEALLQDIHFSCIRPFENIEPGQPEKYLILLHGLMDNSTAWFLKTNLYRLAEQYGVTVFCPEGHRSFYCDMEYGAKYRTLVVKEIPRVMTQMFGYRLNSENTVIAGNSAGGYGALKAVLTPDSIYRKCMAFSPVTEALSALDVIPDDYLIPEEEKAIWGSDKKVTDTDKLDVLMNDAKLKEKFPLEISITCGKDDFLITQNRELHRQLAAAGIPITYTEANGEHGWEYWDAHIKELFERFFSQQLPENEKS